MVKVSDWSPVPESGLYVPAAIQSSSPGAEAASPSCRSEKASCQDVPAPPAGAAAFTLVGTLPLADGGTVHVYEANARLGAKVKRNLDALGWQKAYVVGHSWGGHLALHVAEAMPERLLGVVAVDPLGPVGDGRWPEFDEEIFRRTPEDVRARARELDELSMAGETDDELALEGMRLVWPAYFADPESAPPMPELRSEVPLPVPPTQAR